MVAISGLRTVPVDPVSESSPADFVHGWGCGGSGGNGSATGVCYHQFSGAVTILGPGGSYCCYCGLKTQVNSKWCHVFLSI